MIDERKKRLAEEILRCTPRTKIAEQLGVSRQTLYKWMQEPEWQYYFSKLVSEMEAARRMRLMPVVLKAVELLEAHLDYQLRLLNDPQAAPDERLQVERIGVVVDCLKKIHELEARDSGKPVGEGTGADDSKDDGKPRKRTRLESFLDTLLEEDAAHDPSEVAVAETKEKVH